MYISSQHDANATSVSVATDINVLHAGDVGMGNLSQGTPHPWRPAGVTPAKSRRLLAFASRLDHGRSRFTVVVTASAIVNATSIAVAAVTVVAAATG